MVADVEFELEDVLAQHFLLDDLELGLVEHDVAHGRQGLHRDVIAAGAVVHNLERHLRGADETQHAGLDHFLIERRDALLVFFQLLGLAVAVLVVPAADLVVLAVDFLVLGDDLGPFRVGGGGGVDGHAVGLGVEQDPGALERALHPFELAARLRLDEHVTALFAAGAGRVGGRGEMQVQ